MSANRVANARFLVGVVALAVALVSGGCSGDEGGPPGQQSTLAEPGEAPTLAVKPVTSSGKVVGRLPRKHRVRVEKAVSGVAVRWLDAAYLGGSYPRQRFRNSFGMFTPGARTAARHDLDRMTNARIGSRIEGVTPTRIRVRVDLLAVKGRAVTGTAHVDARFRTHGDASRTYRVAGRLMMTRQRQRWRVFAYDVSRARVDGSGGGQARGGGGQDRHKNKNKNKSKSKNKNKGKNKRKNGARA